ncbi:hypothetical protein Bbelb_350590 [Branchiostoma belcheri]|nr:hypothetical protein Bbelb_350590 [Branchiostoma belcheri]
MERAVKKAMQAILSCYAGNHSECDKNSLVCRHPSVWKFEKTSKTSSDCKLLDGIMKMRLGPVMLENTGHAADTDKSESVNRCMESLREETGDGRAVECQKGKLERGIRELRRVVAKLDGVLREHGTVPEVWVSKRLDSCKNGPNSNNP